MMLLEIERNVNGEYEIMMSGKKNFPLPQGLISVVQTPFLTNGEIDFRSLERLLEDVIAAGVDGILAPAVASEVEFLSREERFILVQQIANTVKGRVPMIVGASSVSVSECWAYVELAQRVKAVAYLVAVPGRLYPTPQKVLSFFQSVASGSELPLLIQDLRWSEYGLALPVIKELWSTIPTLAGFKIETVPAGPKYTQIRKELGRKVYLCGGWAVPQLIEALDRGVNAMIPESSMIRVYRAVVQHYQEGKRDHARKLLHQLLPVLSFTNQALFISIAFFKRLLARKRIFRYERLRGIDFRWDRYNKRIADELIDDYLQLEEEVRQRDEAIESDRT